MQCVEVCLALRTSVGPLVDLHTLHQHVQVEGGGGGWGWGKVGPRAIDLILAPAQGAGVPADAWRPPQPAAPPRWVPSFCWQGPIAMTQRKRGFAAEAISVDDLERAMERLAVLGGGWGVVAVHGQRYVRSQPIELSADLGAALTFAQARLRCFHGGLRARVRVCLGRGKEGTSGGRAGL